MLLAAALSCGGCRKGGAGSGPRAPDVFVVVFDACSAGYLGCYGDPGGASPNVDRFAKDAVLFENAYSQSASTVPSTASLMTGVRATTHRLSGQSRLSAGLKTMAELLAASGYSTSGFFANPYAGAPPLGLDRGYAHAVQAYALPELQEGRPIEENSGFRVVWPEDLDRQILAAIPGMKAEGQFAYVHFLQPHKPYDPPARYVEAFDPDRLGRCTCGGMSWKACFEQFTAANDSGTVDPVVLAHLVARYRANLKCADDGFGLLIERLKQAGLYENSLIVLMADHGEAFFKHRHFGHNVHLYDDIVRIPMIVKLPAKDRVAPRRLANLVETVDVLPTVLDELGIQRPEYLEGQSLLQLVRGQTDRLAEPYVVMSTMDLRMHAIRAGDKKYIYSSEKVQELYDLRQDPDEQRNLIREDPETAQLLRKSLESMIDLTTGSTQQGPSGLRRDPKMDRLLEKLGYVEGTATKPSSGDGASTKPKDQ
jgi:arylsulfatase A-like enzyme